jgi:hypothetical protein
MHSFLKVAVFFLALWPLLAPASSLFDPIPGDELRPFDADRPGFNDSPRTIDAGHYRVELGAFNYARQGFDSYSAASLEIGAGVFRALEFQVLCDGLEWQGGGVAGIGDTTLRAKLALHGNNARGIAVGIIPSVKIPSGVFGNHHAEEGFRVPFAASMPFGFSVSLMAEWDERLNQSGSGFHPDYTGAVQISHLAWSKVSLFSQYGVSASTDDGQTANASLGAGGTYRLSPGCQLDLGLNFGVSNAAPSVAAAAGFAFRY